MYFCFSPRKYFIPRQSDISEKETSAYWYSVSISGDLMNCLLSTIITSLREFAVQDYETRYRQAVFSVG